MRYILILSALFLVNSLLSAQEENLIYDKNLDVYPDVHSILELEKALDHKIMTRMYTIRKKKVFQYYKASTGEFVGFSADLNKLTLKDIPHFKDLKGFKKLLKQNEPKEALRIYYELEAQNQEIE